MSLKYQVKTNKISATKAWEKFALDFAGNKMALSSKTGRWLAAKAKESKENKPSTQQKNEQNDTKIQTGTKNGNQNPKIVGKFKPRGKNQAKR